MIKTISGRLTSMGSFIIGSLVGAILVNVVFSGILCIKAKNQNTRIEALEKEVKEIKIIVKYCPPEHEYIVKGEE